MGPRGSGTSLAPFFEGHALAPGAPPHRIKSADGGHKAEPAQIDVDQESATKSNDAFGRPYGATMPNEMMARGPRSILIIIYFIAAAAAATAAAVSYLLSSYLS